MLQQFPKVLAAVQLATQHSDRDQWNIGDALLIECGSPGTAARQDGSRARIVAASKMLANLGYDQYTDRYLALLREVSYKFQPKSRHYDLSWKVHQTADSPKFLESVIAGAKGKRVTFTYLIAIRQRQRSRDTEQRHHNLTAARSNRQQAEAEGRQAAQRKVDAKDADERSAAERAELDALKRAAEARELEEVNKLPPKRGDVSPPDPADVPLLALEAEFMADASRSITLAKRSKERIADRVSELSPVAIAAMAEAALDAANVWTDLANVVRKAQGNKRGHLQIVGQ